MRQIRVTWREDGKNGVMPGGVYAKKREALKGAREFLAEGYAQCATSEEYQDSFVDGYVLFETLVDGDVTETSKQSARSLIPASIRKAHDKRLE